MNHLDKEEHSTEELSWIYGFLAILIIGFIVSFYTITISTKKINERINNKNKNAI